MPKVNVGTLKAAVVALEELKAAGLISLEGDFKLEAYRILLARLQEEAERDVSTE